MTEKQSIVSDSPTQPVVSIVMPSFNQARYIEASIQSVLEQEYPRLELIVVDGGSTDGTPGILERYRHRLSHCVVERDRGQSDALNKGFALATGDIYGWLNSDDLYTPGAVALAVAAFQRSPEKAVVYGDWLEIDERGNQIQRQYAFDFSLPHFMYEGFHLNAQSMFWRASAHQAFGGFDIDLHRTMDYQLILLLGKRVGSAAFLRLPDVLGCFRRHAEQKTSPRGRCVVEREHRKMATAYGYPEKYALRGRLYRLRYRVRRAWWYAYRGGFGCLLSRFLGRKPG